MAERHLRNALGDFAEVHSAGAKPAGYVHPLAIEAMDKIGIDVSGHESKHLEKFLDAGITTVITVCGNANDACPVFPGNVNRYHWGFEDPPHAQRDGEELIDAFCRIRDEIKLVFEAYASGLKESSDL
ncbi:UNVERIFIED_CONTAM: hypothetical protein GTU68_021367 [Idotea baltica]|nr:hypothetical protein [Idotea baltica]